MAKKERERSTARMPSGAQQYTRGGNSQARLRNIDNLIRRRRLNSILDGADINQVRSETRAMHEAFMDEADRSRAAYQNEMQAMQETRANRRKEGGAMKSKKSAAPAASKRPMPNPRSGMTERGSRHDEGMTREAMERGSSAPSRSPRPTARRKDGGKVKKMAYGGKVMKKAEGGFPDLNKDGKVTQADILQGRGVKKMAMGGKCRGMGAATRGGNYSRG